MRAALTRYRIIAYVVGVVLIVLVVVGMPLKYLGDNPTVVETVGPAHGFLYMVYLVAVFDLGRRARWPIGRMLLVMLAGTIPFVVVLRRAHGQPAGRGLGAESPRAGRRHRRSAFTAAQSARHASGRKAQHRPAAGPPNEHAARPSPRRPRTEFDSQRLLRCQTSVRSCNTIVAHAGLVDEE